MNKIIKITQEESENLLFCSDLHRGHAKDFLLNPRRDGLGIQGDWTSDDHVKWQDEQWDKYVTEKTTVINLGDVCFGDPEGKEFERLSKFTCKNHYVLEGNHVSGQKQCYNKAIRDYFENIYGCPISDRSIKELPEVYPLKFNNMTFCGNDLTLRIGKKGIICSHFPKRIWDHMGRNSFSLSGHSHGNDSNRNVSAKNGKALDVGVENAIIYGDKMFFSYQEIRDIMKNKTVELIDHHDSNTH